MSTTFSRPLRPSAPAGRCCLWLFLALNLFQAFGYWMFSGLGGIGDWQAVIAGTPHYALARLALAVVGIALAGR